MKIVKENIDNLNAVIRMTVEKEDYEQKVDKKLREHRKSASLKGFRAGKVPLGLIKKMYGKSVLGEEVNAVISENLMSYIRDEKLNILGEPLGNETEQKEIDFDSQTEFEFIFDIGLAPEVSIELTKEQKFPYYKIKADEKLVEDSMDRYAYQYGEQKKTEIVAEDDVVYCEIAEINDAGEIVEGGLFIEKAPVSVKTIKEEAITAQFIGANVNEVLNFDITKAFTNDADMAALFNVEQATLAETVKSKKFNFTIKEILHFTKAEINQELFDKAFGAETVKSEEEFKAKVEEQVASQFTKDSDYRFSFDTKEKLISETEIALPDDFLKRWIKRSDEKLTDDVIAKEYGAFAETLRWELIRNNILKSTELKVEEADLKTAAIEVTKAQFAQYGMANLPDEQYEKYAEDLLKEEKQRKNLWETASDIKVLAHIKETVSLDEKALTVDEFKKLYEDEAAEKAK